MTPAELRKMADILRSFEVAGTLRNAADSIAALLDQLRRKPTDPVPDLTTLVKLGSIVVHADEATGPNGHPYDVVALRDLLNDPEVMDWIQDMRRLGFMPVKRDGKD